MDRDARYDERAIARVRKQVEEYCAGKRTEFDLELAPRVRSSSTPSGTRSWQIPYGETRSYGEVARAIGQPKAARGVGSANQANPIGLIVPCHRVIGADGSLTGYGGGLPLKQRVARARGRAPARGRENRHAVLARRRACDLRGTVLDYTFVLVVLASFFAVVFWVAG